MTIPRVSITINPGGNSGGGSGGGPTPPPGPTPSIALYSDEPDSITSVDGVVSAWGVATIAAGTPLLITDSYTGIRAIRLDIGSTLTIPANATLDAMATGDCTVIAVWRNRKFLENVELSIFDSSVNNTHVGYRLLAKDQFGSGFYREMRARISNGSSWVLDGPGSNTAWNAFAGLKTNATAVTTSATRSNLNVDHIDSYDLADSYSLPAGPAGDGVLGGSQIDLFAYLVYSPALTDEARADVVDDLNERFLLDVVQQVAGDGNLHIGIPGSCILDNGDILCSYRVAVDHAANPPGYLETKRSSDGGFLWTEAYQIHDTTSPTILDIRDSNLTQLSNGDVLINYFTADALTGYGNVQVRRSTDGGHTFGAPTTLGPFGYDLFEACSAPIIEDPLNPGVLYCPIYCQNTGGFSDAGYSKSTDNGATWGSFVVVCDGTADSAQYYEPGFVFLTATFGPFTAGTILGLVRDGTNFVMRLITAAANGTGWTLNANTTNLLASSAGRLAQLQSGRIVWAGRPFTLTSGTIYYLKEMVLGEATWSIVIFDAPGLDATTGIYIYGTILERTPGVMTIIYSPQFGDVVHNWAFVRCRARWPEWQLNGDMPQTIAPTSATVDPLDNVQFSGLGPGNDVWAIPVNNSGGSINASSGLYTAGSTGGDVDTVRKTNINDFTEDALVTVNGSSVIPPTSIDAGNLTAWWSPGVGLVLDGGSPGGGGQISTWTSADSSARVLTAAAGPTTQLGLNGNLSVRLNGTTQSFSGTDVINTLVGASSWTIGLTWKDSGSIADTGNYFLNANILASATDGFFAIGSTATQIFGGQDNSGAGTTYDILAAAAATAHYAVLQYDAVAGKIFISLNGAPFDAGTTVPVLGSSSSSIIVGISLIGARFKGELGELPIWKSKLTGANLTNLKAFLADSIA